MINNQIWASAVWSKLFTARIEFVGKSITIQTHFVAYMKRNPLPVSSWNKQGRLQVENWTRDHRCQLMDCGGVHCLQCRHWDGLRFCNGLIPGVWNRCIIVDEFGEIFLLRDLGVLGSGVYDWFDQHVRIVDRLAEPWSMGSTRICFCTMLQHDIECVVLGHREQ